MQQTLTLTPHFSLSDHQNVIKVPYKAPVEVIKPSKEPVQGDIGKNREDVRSSSSVNVLINKVNKHKFYSDKDVISIKDMKSKNCYACIVVIWTPIIMYIGVHENDRSFDKYT